VSAPGNTSALALAGQRVITEASRLWNLDVIDPPIGDTRAHAIASCEIISDIIAAAGWSSSVPYRGNGSPQWCVMFAHKCWRAAGLVLDLHTAAAFMASTIRLEAWLTYQPWNEHKNVPRPTDGDVRLMALLDDKSTSLPFEPRAGDIMTIGDGKRRPGRSPREAIVGTHCVVMESFDAARGVFHTIEGNGWGTGPRGDKREGIVRAERRLGGPGMCVRMIGRPGFGDLRAEAP
jgi:hypothetical protein